MELRRTSVRRAGLAAVAALLALGASACSGGTGLTGTPPAATVNGTEISQERVTDITRATREFYEYSVAKGQDDGTLTSLLENMKADSADAVGTLGASRVLQDLIVDEVIRQDLVAHDALPSKRDKEDLRSQIAQSVGGVEELKKFPTEYIDFYIESQSMRNAFRSRAAEQYEAGVVPLTDEEREEQMRTLYEQTSSQQPLCLNAIQTTSESAAAEARQRVEAGEDFLAVAEAYVPEGSQFPEGGLVACVSFEEASSTFGHDFTTAAVGDLVGPLTYTPQSGAPAFLVFRIDDIDGRTYEEMLPELEQAVPTRPNPVDPADYDDSNERADAVGEADVVVNPIFGTWSAAQLQVIPPRVPGATTTTAPLAELTGS